MKKEIINVKVLPAEPQDKGLADSLKVEILVSQSDFPAKSFRSFLGEIPEDFIEILRNTRALVKFVDSEECEESEEHIRLTFIYPDMTMEQKRMMSKLFFGREPQILRTWKKNSKYNGYLSNNICIFDKERLIPNFIGSMICYGTNGLFTGSVKYRVRHK